MLVYFAGLRVGEVVKLRPEDIDSKRMLIHIKESKGRKDRYTLLSETALEISGSSGGNINPINGYLKGSEKDGIFL